MRICQIIFTVARLFVKIPRKEEEEREKKGHSGRHADNPSSRVFLLELEHANEQCDPPKV